MLIQETVRYDVGKLYPAIKNSIKGEESNKFENQLGEKVIIEIDDDSENTYQMLHKVLDGNESAARELADEIHRPVVTRESQELPNSLLDVEIDQDIGLWIDPIDGTAEYINGNDVPSSIPNIQKSGLQCSTVLIGVYDKTTALPLIGVICIPFAIKDENERSHKSIIYYGACIKGIKYSNVSTRQSSERQIAIISSSEQHKTSVFDTVMAAGAGYKALKVIEGDADIYYLSKASTFKWDTCACQAILMSIGGDMVEMKNSIAEMRPIPLKYTNDDDKCNVNGLIAYRNVDNFYRLANDLSSIQC